MRGLISILSCILMLWSASQLFANENLEFQKAYDYLNERNEVYFTISANSPAEIQKLVYIISVDKVEFPDVYAYANTEGFEEFLKTDLEYMVLTPPGLLGPPATMSDYSEYLVEGKVPEWDQYPTFDAYLGIMEQFETDYPALCKIEKYGESEQGRDLLVAKISDNVGTEEPEPGFFWTSTLHGDETLGYMNSLHMIDYLCSNYSSDQTVKGIVDNIEVWIAPNCNPDGTYRGGNSTLDQAQRYNSNGKDLNRNFPCPSGKYGLSSNSRWEDEVKACMDFEDPRNFVLGCDIHGGMENVVYPWAYTRKYPNDRDWWEYVSERYADLAQGNSPSGYFTTTQSDGVGCAGMDYYQAPGTRIDYPIYGTSCRALTLEQNSRKKLEEHKLLDHWDYNKDAMLQLLQETLNGVHGMVTDTFSGEPLIAKVFVEDHDQDSSHVYSDELGAYCRPIYQGTYEFTFTSGEYTPKTISNVSVTNGQPTVLDVQLVGPVNIGLDNAAGSIPVLITPFSNGIVINYGSLSGNAAVGIYNMDGKLIKALSLDRTNNNSVRWDGKDIQGRNISNGCYIIRLVSGNKIITKNFILNR